MTYLITLQQVNWKRFKKFKTRSGGKEKTNCLCRERQAINCKVCDNLWSYSSYQKIPTKFPNSTESTVRLWVKSHQKMIQEQNKKGETSVQSTIGRVRGQPLLIEEVLDLKLRSMLVNLRAAGAGINIQVVSGVLNGSIRANPERFGKYMDFKVTRS